MTALPAVAGRRTTLTVASFGAVLGPADDTESAFD
jgi:hypothetical protein